ncbi:MULTISPECIES: hypothetical protein [Butyricimonas]|uniref:hypothetical protein n=1 Tax=Butyricimonas TaxID=574697 RepID=UPI0025903E8E|nr:MULTISPECIES: hypothetical protein [Butyricimonas]
MRRGHSSSDGAGGVPGRCLSETSSDPRSKGWSVETSRLLGRVPVGRCGVAISERQRAATDGHASGGWELFLLRF